MPAIRASTVARAETFNGDLAELAAEFPEIEDVVLELEEFLRLDYLPSHVPVDPDAPDLKNVYAVHLDYPPEGAEGLNRLFVKYHATDPNPSMGEPYRTFTLLTIDES